MTRLNLENHRILAVFRETTERSALPTIVGAKPFGSAEVWATRDGVVRLANGDASLRIFGDQQRRILRGHSTRRLMLVEGRYERNDDGSWRETESLVLEYGTLDALEARGMPNRRMSSALRDDRSLVTSTFERVVCPANDEELLKKTTCLVHADRSRVEEEESILRVQQKARYELCRRESGPGRQETKRLEYRYPWLPHEFYASVWNNLVELAMSSKPWVFSTAKAA